METNGPVPNRGFVGVQLTLLGIVCLLLPLSISDLSASAFSGAGLLFVIAGTIVVVVASIE